MPYNSLIDRTDATPLIPEEVSRSIIEALPEASVALKLFRIVPMSRAQQRVPVLSTLATAYFVSGDTGLKQTTEIAWENKYLNAEELAVIVPIPEAVLEDAEFDIWDSVRERAVEAFGKALDAAIFFGTNKPTSWPDDIVTAATAAGHVVNLGSDLVADIGSESGIMAMVEADGFDVDFFVGDVSMKARLRNLRDNNGQFIYQPKMTVETPDLLFGQPLTFVKNGAWDATSALLICGDRNAGIIGLRSDIRVRRLDQAVIQDNTGAIVYNLAQQDMVALRMTMRVAWQVPNPTTNLGGGAAGQYPFAVLAPAGG